MPLSEYYSKPSRKCWSDDHDTSTGGHRTGFDQASRPVISSDKGANRGLPQGGSRGLKSFADGRNASSEARTRSGPKAIGFRAAPRDDDARWLSDHLRSHTIAAASPAGPCDHASSEARTSQGHQATGRAGTAPRSARAERDGHRAPAQQAPRQQTHSSLRTFVWFSPSFCATTHPTSQWYCRSGG